MTLEPTKTLPNWEVLAYILAELGELQTSVHLEKIADRAYQLTPGAFRWELDEFSDRIDKDKVRVSLTDLEKRSKGKLARAIGKSQRGQSKKTDVWQLTPEGVDWIIDNKDRIERALKGPRLELKRGKATELRNRLAASGLYRQYRSGAKLEYSPYEFTDLLECSPDARSALIQGRFDWLLNQVRLLDDPDLVTFVRTCGAVHADMLVGEDDR